MSLARVTTIEVSAATPTWQQVYPVTGMPDGGTLYIGFQCQNMPTDGFVAFSVPGPDQADSVNIPKTPITSPSMMITVQVTWPTNYATNATLDYWQGATAPPVGASISPVIFVPAGDGQMVMVSKTTYQFK
ncbi:MAG: hypothetical protein K0R39_1670 [Symbiobacteriaceae bacterium]|jgi:hypothetical protein|nr:hypothetical protein [Symbiobacteriaceae bacterium]